MKTQIHQVILSCLLAVPCPAFADLSTVVSDLVLPATAEFNIAAADFADLASKDCQAAPLRPAYHQVFDAWIGISHLRFGPMEQMDGGQSIAYWPDAKGFTARALANLIATEDPVINTTAEFAHVSVAGRGLFAIERMLFDPELSSYDDESYSCRLVQALARDLAVSAAELDRRWHDDFADVILTAGAEDNQVFLSEEEAIQIFYTALLSGLEFDESVRLGRPLGTFERPRPNRAESLLSERSLRNLTLSLIALRQLADALGDQDVPATDAAFAQVIAKTVALDDPVFQGVETPQSRLKIEIIQIDIRNLMDRIEIELGPKLGVTAGFNSQDGD